MESKDQFTIRQPEYLESFEAFRDSESLKQIATKLQEQIYKKGSDLHCLDLMAGTGVVGHKMREVFDQIKVVFQDKSPKMLASNSYRDDERITSDAVEIGLQDDTFDIVFCRGGLNNVAEEDYSKILKEYVRILNNDGIVILQDHFARTKEEKDVINLIEAEVANLEGKNDATYVPTVLELEQLIQDAGGKISNKQSFEIRLSLKDRFLAKGINNPDLSKIKTILKNQTHFQYEETKDDIVVVYPIFTITFAKNSEVAMNKTEQEKAAESGWMFLELENQDGFFPSYITSARDTHEAQQAPREVFSSIIIADTLSKQSSHDELRKATLSYIKKQAQQGQLSFFEDKSLITPDTDTNSLGYSVLLKNGLITPEAANSVLDTILEHKDGSGKVQVWLSKDRENRLDHVVGANTVYLAHLLGRGSEVKPTEEWLITILDSEEYLQGSRYYHSPDSFLYSLGKLMEFPELEKKLKTKLKQCLQQRMGKTEYPLDLAIRTILADLLGIQNNTEKQTLLNIQEQDGSWPADTLYREGTRPRYYGNKSVPTAFALQSLSSK